MQWNDLVARILLDDSTALETLYEVFATGIRLHVGRQIGFQDVEDKVHDTFLIVLDAIRRGQVRQPERLMGFVHTVVRRQVAAHIEQTVQSRRQNTAADSCFFLVDAHTDPEKAAIVRERQTLAEAVLNLISGRDREVLMRFYLKEQSQEHICEQMALTGTQFRLLKNRAKARFGEIGKRKLQRRFAFN